MLIIVAVEAERAALRPKPGQTVIVSGIGPAQSAAAAAVALANKKYDTVISAGIAGGFAAAGVNLGDIVIANRICFADLGAHSPEKFLDAQSLGWPGSTYDCPAATVADYAQRIRATGLMVHTGTILTVAAATGTAARAAELYAKYNPIAEAMEGAGVAAACVRSSVLSPQSSVLEVRAISNLVGPRDLKSWDIPRALASLATALEALPS